MHKHDPKDPIMNPQGPSADGPTRRNIGRVGLTIILVVAVLAFCLYLAIIFHGAFGIKM